MNYLYVFVDVSGNYDFSSRGTKYLALTSVLTTDIDQGTLELHRLKHNLIDQGIDLEYFHASEDRQAVRDRVFAILADLSNIRADAVVVEKRKTDPTVQPHSRFYPMMIENLLKYPFHPRGINVSHFDKVFIFLDRESTRRNEREALIKGVKHYLARHLGKVPYVICMHRSTSHPYLQIVDYFSWAIYVNWERGETRPYNIISHLIKSEFPIFQHRLIYWY